EDDLHVAWNGQTFLVVWGVLAFPFFEGSPPLIGTAALRVAADGTPLDQIATLIDAATPTAGPSVFHATVASNGHDFLIALDGARDLSDLPVSASGVVGSRHTIF